MKITNASDGTRTIADTGDVVEPDGQATVPKKLGEALCQQEDVWQKVKTTKKSKKSDESGDD